MDIYFRRIWKCILAFDSDNIKNRIKRLSRTQKRNILLLCILLLCMRLFFSADLYHAYADVEEVNLSDIEYVSKETLDPMGRIIKDKKEATIDNSEKVCSKKIEKKKSEFNLEKAESLVSGYPIEAMLPYIEKRDKKTAYFLIAIAKKESDWGRHAPTKNGRDCFNYWGYKGSYKPSMGYSCFDSPEQAIQVVGDRIQKLVDKKIDTPSKMVVWKCGSSCAGHNAADVRKWIYDVDLYFRKMDA
jgi:hypothetical protein